MDTVRHYASPLGSITLASDGEALIGLWFDGQRHFAETLSPEHSERNPAVFDETVHWLDLYFSDRKPDFTPPLKLRGTAFRRRTWQYLLTVPYGSTVTYGRIADALAEGQGLRHPSARAVGNAVGHNPISLIIPCHRVVGANGSLTGYAGGLEKKLYLLRLERGDL